MYISCRFVRRLVVHPVVLLTISQSWDQSVSRLIGLLVLEAVIVVMKMSNIVLSCYTVSIFVTFLIYPSYGFFINLCYASFSSIVHRFYSLRFLEFIKIIKKYLNISLLYYYLLYYFSLCLRLSYK